MANIGTICYATSRGLGHLAKNFIDNGIINDICVVNHPSVPRNRDWYPNAPEVNMRGMDRRVLQRYVKGHDAMLFFETPFSWDIINYCKMYNIRTYLVTMYECTPQILPCQPDRFLCPSLLDLQEFPNNSELVSIPVEVPWEQRHRAVTFVHNGGYLGMKGREGTELLIEAMQYVRHDIELIIRVQENVSPTYIAMCNADRRISYRPETVPFEELYAEGDVFVAPQKFNGMSMPLLEARASGMCILTTDRFPTTECLGTDGFYIPVERFETIRLAQRFRPIQYCHINPKDIAASIDALYGRDISQQSLNGKYWGEVNGWAAQRSKWLEILSK